MYVKVHSIRGKKIAAICDNELIGKKFSDGNLELDVDKDFYGGKEMDESDAIKIMKDVAILNIVGDEAIKLALGNNLVLKQDIIKIKGVPHAQRI